MAIERDPKAEAPVKDQLSAEDPYQMYLRSPRGQYNRELQGRVNRGEITHDQSKILFQQRFPDAIGARAASPGAPAVGYAPGGAMPPMTPLE